MTSQPDSKDTFPRAQSPISRIPRAQGRARHTQPCLWGRICLSAVLQIAGRSGWTFGLVLYRKLHENFSYGADQLHSPGPFSSSIPAMVMKMPSPPVAQTAVKPQQCCISALLQVHRPCPFAATEPDGSLVLAAELAQLLLTAAI